MDSFREKIAAFREGKLNSDELADLVQRLRDDDADIDEFVLECLLHDELHQCLSEGAHLSSIDLEQLQPTPAAPAGQEVSVVRRWFRSRTTMSVLSAGLVMAVVLFSLAMWQVPQWRPAMLTREPTYVAVISSHQNAIWNKASDGNGSGSRLVARDRLILDSGSAVITYESGALVVLEGPASYTIQSGNSGDLQHGKLVARIAVDEAKGFAVDIPGGQIVDLGTEFGVDVDEDAADVAVLTGEVELVSSGNSSRQRLVANETASVDGRTGEVERRDVADESLLAAMRGRLDQLSTGTVLAHFGLEESLSPDATALGLTASHIRMSMGGFSSMGPPEGLHSRFIRSEETDSANPPTISDIHATWTLTPEAGKQVALDRVTWKLLTHTRVPFDFHSKLFVSSDPDFNEILAESEVFTVTRHRNDRLSPIVAARLNAALTSSRPLYFGLAFTDTGDEKSNGRFDAIYVNGSVTAASN